MELQGFIKFLSDRRKSGKSIDGCKSMLIDIYCYPFKQYYTAKDFETYKYHLSLDVNHMLKEFGHFKKMQAIDKMTNSNDN